MHATITLFDKIPKIIQICFDFRIQQDISALQYTNIFENCIPDKNVVSIAGIQFSKVFLLRIWIPE